MNWFLILYIAGHVSAVQLATKDACEAAGKAAQANQGARYTCLYKG